MSEFDLVGVAEAAEILGVEKPRISRWVEAKRMPAAVVDLEHGRLWTRDSVEALAEVRDALLRIDRPRNGSLDLVRSKEAAEILSVDKSQIGRWVRDGKFPDHVVRVQAGKYWRRRDVERFGRERGRI